MHRLHICRPFVELRRVDRRDSACEDVAVRARRARRRRRPGSRPPQRSTPTASRLAPRVDDRRARAGVDVDPAGDPLAVPEPELERGAPARPPRSACPRARPASAAARIPSPAPSAITVGMPAPAASSAAATLLSMPAAPERAARPEVDACARPRRPRSARPRGARPGTEVSSTSSARVHEHRHLRGECVVVAEADLVGRGRVVLVHDRHAAEREERARARCAR